MKGIFLLITHIFILNIVYAQTYTSINDGNWTNPSTWSPAGVPYPGCDIIINTNVILDTDFGYSQGSVTINQNASLIKDTADRNFAVYNGSFINNGTFIVRNFAVINGTMENSGTIQAKRFFLNIALTNYGIIEQIDSLNSTYYLTNTVDATISTNNFYNQGYLINNGQLNANNYLNQGYCKNIGTMFLGDLYNQDTLINENKLIFSDFTNAAYFQNNLYLTGNNDCTNKGTFLNQGIFTLTNNFLNHDTLSNNAIFIITGKFLIANNFFNEDTISGSAPGQICVYENSWNQGAMLGNFDFCDNTPPPSTPYIDCNNGYVDSNITFCSMPCELFNLNSINSVNYIMVYPNPFVNNINIRLHLITSSQKFICEIYNIIGNKIYEMKIQNSYTNIKLNNVYPGIYYLRIKTEQGNILYSKIISKL